jgi:hypothetical protein
MAQTVNYSLATTAPSGTGLPWTITGSNLASIYTSATSGTVTTGAGGTATLSFNLTTNATSSTATFTLSVNGGDCGIVTDTLSVPGTVTPPTPPTYTTYCNSRLIPLIYCPVYDQDGVLYNVSVQKYAYVKVAPVGGVTVPTGVSVSAGSIVASGTVQADNAATSGVDLNIITSFDTPSGPSDPLITGTTTVVKGWF